MTQQIDELVAQINRDISEVTQQVSEERVPDFTGLDTKISSFAEILDTLPPEQQKEYAPLLKTWGDEIRKVSDVLGQLKERVEGKLDGANSGSQASSAYGATSNLGKPANE